jgi:hypothetical protein
MRCLTVLRSMSSLIPLVACVACAVQQVGRDEAPGEGDVASIELALATVPLGQQCLQVVVHSAPGGVPAGAALTSRSFALTGGAASWSGTVGLGAFARGTVQLTALTFNVACASITGATASWVADPIVADVTPGVRTSLTLEFRENFSVSATGNFAPSLTKIAAGSSATGVVLDVGTVRTAGSIGYPLTLTGVANLDLGTLVACAIRTDATMVCWGHNGYGQLATGNTTTPGTAFTQIAGLSNVSAITAGGLTSCASTDRDTYCWGYNSNGTVGDGTTVDRYTPTLISGLRVSTRIAMSQSHACAISAADGQVRCWGYNGDGELGNGTTVQSLSPVVVTGLSAVVSLGVGLHHSCAVDASGRAFCWGDNDDGELGLGDYTNRLVPTQITSLPEVAEIATMAAATCALTVEGEVYCWGANNYGQVGDGTGMDTPVPQLILDGVKQLSAGDDTHVCALRFDNSGRCWGRNHARQLMDGTTVTRFEPVKMVL